MSLAGFQARNHPQQDHVAVVDDRATTWAVFRPLHRRFRFTVDVAASARNTKLERFFDVDVDGLLQPWEGERVWCNPPYSELRPWVEKAWAESGCPLVVMIVPANRTEQGWWQDLVEPYRDRAGSPLTVEFLPGRLRFIAPDAERVRPNERPPFGCCLLVWNREVPAPAQRRSRQERLL